MAIHSRIYTVVTLFSLLISLCYGTSSKSLVDAPVKQDILQTNYFRENLLKNASFNDPMLRRELWKGISLDDPPKKKFVRDREIKYTLTNKQQSVNRGLSKRAMPDPLIKVPSCLTCAPRAQDRQPVNMGMFSADNLVNQMKLLAVYGDCLFYQQRPAGSDPRSLSGQAQLYTCVRTFQYRCIWDLWPSDKDSETPDKAESNYYCLNPWEEPWEKKQICWLDPLMAGAVSREQRIANAMLYFQQMSQAMAMTCSGNVYILSEDTSTIPNQIPGERPSIWLTHELPTLQELYAQGTVKKLIAITGTVNAWTGSEDVTRYLRPSKRSAPPPPTELTKKVAKAIMEKRAELIRSGYSLTNFTEEYADHHKLQKRICGGAAKWEDPNMDYFG